MKYCKKCGNQLKTDELLCEKCGIITNEDVEVKENLENKVAEVIFNQPEVKAEENQIDNINSEIMKNERNQNLTKNEKKVKNNKFMIIIAILILAIICGGIAYFVLTKKTKIYSVAKETANSSGKVSIEERKIKKEDYSPIERVVVYIDGSIYFQIDKYSSSEEAKAYVEFNQNKYKMYHEKLDNSILKENSDKYFSDEKDQLYADDKYVLDVFAIRQEKYETLKNDFIKAVNNNKENNVIVDKNEIDSYYQTKLDTISRNVENDIALYTEKKREEIKSITNRIDGCLGATCDELVASVSKYESFNIFDVEIKEAKAKYDDVINKKKAVVNQINSDLTKVEKSLNHTDYDNIQEKINKLTDPYYNSYKTGWNKRIDAIDKAVYKKSCKTINYKEALRYPDKYMGKRSYWVGKILQKVDSSTFRVSTKCEWLFGTRYCTDNVIYVKYYGDESFIEDDYVKIWGELDGNQSYIAVLGNEITIPRVSAEYMQRQVLYVKKRLLFVIILSVFAITLSGCGKKEWEEKFEVSEFKYEDKYVKGEIKNRTNEDFIVKIYFEYTSGSIKEEDTEELLIKGGSTEKVSSYFSSIDEKYKIKIKNIEFNPTLKINMDKDKQLTGDELKNAFYIVHKLHFGMTSVSDALVKGSYNSYTNELIYYVAKKLGSTDNHIYIYGDLYGGIIRLLESYKADSQKPEVIGLTVKDKSFQMKLNHL